MWGLSADNLLAAAAVWVAIMLPSAAFGWDTLATDKEGQRCQAQEITVGLVPGPGLSLPTG